jgi:hypothetical protein
MSATLIVRHTVADYGTWRKAYDSAEPLRVKYGCTAQHVLQLPNDANDVAAIHEFPSVSEAEAFAADPALRTAMEQGGVTAEPRIEIFQNV